MVFWFDQGDAAADDEAEVRLVDGGGAQKQRPREEEEGTKGQQERKEKGSPAPIYKAKRYNGKCENRGAQKMDK